MDSVADFLRSEQTKIGQLWEAEVRRDNDDARLVLRDHLPTFLDALADWIEGDVARAEDAFALVIENPALQVLGYGVGIETLTREYSRLRVVLVRELIARGDLDDSFVRLQQAMDLALEISICGYATRREEVRERFIGILGHDLRDPLSTILISARVLAANHAIDRENRFVASRIVRSCNRMQRMINDVLDFARGHLGGGIPALPTTNDMGDICRTAVDEIIAAHPQREVTCEVSGDLVGELDRDRVHQAITNLLSNAIHHGEGPIEVRAWGNHEIVTEVISHGPPIPEPLIPLIFEPFAHGETGKGLGLGLYIVQQIAHAHGGRCEVDSNDTATTFRIRWPRREQRDRAAS